jgi:hypothetical protein
LGNDRVCCGRADKVIVPSLGTTGSGHPTWSSNRLPGCCRRSWSISAPRSSPSWHLLVYTRITSHNEFQLIRDNDPAAAIALGLSLLGLWIRQQLVYSDRGH